jgi:D-alanine-D-alanine ligase
MRIAFTHNIQLTDAEEEAEFDRPETVAAITQALRSLGHEVEPVEVSGPASRVVARLEALSPDLVFNTAEGSQGRFREAFFPALFDRLGLPFTGADAYVCALTLDKHLTKTLLRDHGIRVPEGHLVTDLGMLEGFALRFPVIVKPNYEGSSMGIDRNAVVEHLDELRDRLTDLLRRYPAGVLVEEYVRGRDIVVPYLEKASPQTGGVLPAASYSFDPEVVGDRKYVFYDYELKGTLSHAVTVNVPAAVPNGVSKRLTELSRTVFRVLGMRDMGRIDYRVTDDGEIFFLEVNALPSLEPGASIYESAALVGLKTMPKVLSAIVESAAERFGLDATPRRGRRQKALKVGLTFNLRRKKAEGTEDAEAEFDTPETIGALEQAIASFGHEVVRLEATPELPAILPASGVDVVFNLAEGIAGHAREAQVPALLELLGIPYTGSDPTALSLALDKALAKRVVAQAGLPTAPFMLMSTGKEKLVKELTFPAIAKPNAEGSSKGIGGSSVVHDEGELRERVKEMVVRYRQPILVESFLPGREFTVALLGERRPKVLPPLEVLFAEDAGPLPIYSFESKFASKGVSFEVPAKVEPALGKEIARVAKGVFSVLGCRDVARVDLRLDAQGRVCFIEVNPLPGLAPGFSDYCVIAQAAGMDYRSLVGEILAPAIRRHREKQKQRVLSARL